MAGIWGVYGHRGQNGNRYFPDPDLVRLYILPYHGFPADRLFYPGLLDEHEKVHFVRP
jgi:hypothetical protein